MFDLPPASGQDLDKPPKPPSVGEAFGIHLLSEVELLRLRAEVDRLLPTKALVDMNLERELVLQYVTVQNLQSSVITDENVPANQKAQTANAVAASLASLAKLQGDVHTSERIKKVEQVLIEVLQTLPTETQAQFLDRYGQVLEERGL